MRLRRKREQNFARKCFAIFVEHSLYAHESLCNYPFCRAFCEAVNDEISSFISSTSLFRFFASSCEQPAEWLGDALGDYKIKFIMPIHLRFLVKLTLILRNFDNHLFATLQCTDTRTDVLWPKQKLMEFKI